VRDYTYMRKRLHRVGFTSREIPVVGEFQSILVRFHFRVNGQNFAFDSRRSLARLSFSSAFTYIQGILIRVENESGIDDFSR